MLPAQTGQSSSSLGVSAKDTGPNRKEPEATWLSAKTATAKFPRTPPCGAETDVAKAHKAPGTHHGDTDGVPILLREDAHQGGGQEEQDQGVLKLKSENRAAGGPVRASFPVPPP